MFGLNRKAGREPAVVTTVAAKVLAVLFQPEAHGDYAA